MFNFFAKKTASDLTYFRDFDYLEKDKFYFDTACQTLRPGQVIDSEVEYYHKFNSCGHRVKYSWGEQTDKLVEECRENLLKLVKKSSKEYTVAFTLNTTFGINHILFQLPTENFESVVSSEIEHNSVFLPVLNFAKKFDKKRFILKRDQDGSLIYEKNQLEKAVVLLNSTSNIHGLNLVNGKQLAVDIHEKGGILMLDACQSFAHNPELLAEIDFDAVFGSGHKMYGPSVGFIIIKKDLIRKIEPYLIGGSTVSKVDLDSYDLIQNENELYARIEPGLQNYAGIIGLNQAIKWRENWKFKIKNKLENIENLQQSPDDWLENVQLEGKSATEYETALADILNQKLLNLPNIKLLNQKPSSVVSLYPTKDDWDGHKLALMLGQTGIMCRSGYHCCHYYLQKKLALPPLFRISLGLNNTVEQIEYLYQKMKVLVG